MTRLSFEFGLPGAGTAGPDEQNVIWMLRQFHLGCLICKHMSLSSVSRESLKGRPTLERCAMHRLASVHLDSCSHYFFRKSLTIVTATGQRATVWYLSGQPDDRPDETPTYMYLRVVSSPYEPISLWCKQLIFGTASGVLGFVGLRRISRGTWSLDFCETDSESPGA